MSTKLNKYRKGKIYIIRSDQSDQIYIGSTVKSLKRRLQGHEDDFKRFNKDNYNMLDNMEMSIIHMRRQRGRHAQCPG